MDSWKTAFWKLEMLRRACWAVDIRKTRWFASSGVEIYKLIRLRTVSPPRDRQNRIIKLYFTSFEIWEWQSCHYTVLPVISIIERSFPRPRPRHSISITAASWLIGSSQTTTFGPQVSDEHVVVYCFRYTTRDCGKNVPWHLSLNAMSPNKSAP